MKLFISYRSLNSDRVDSVVTRLRSLPNNAGKPRYTIWQDKHNIPAGKDWWESIVEAIIDCDVMLFMISRDSVQNINCRAELNYARRRNRPIIPVVLENEFVYSPISGKFDVEYAKDIPADLTEMRTQYLFYQGTSFIHELETALDHIIQQPQRWVDFYAPKPPDPRPRIDGDDNFDYDTSVIYDQACDYALRLEIDTAERLFQRLVIAIDPLFSQEASEWIPLLREYAELLRLDARDNTRFKVQARWDKYAAQFPKVFITFFDPKNLKERYSAAFKPLTNVPSIRTPNQTVTAERQQLLDIMLDWERYAPSVRAEAGRRLTEIGDPRPGVGLRPDGLPDIVWCEVPSGKTKLGGDKGAYQSLPEQVIDLPTFYIAKFPVTYLQFQAFLNATDGEANVTWWQGLAERHTARGKQRFEYANHPRENVNWYDSIAFCRWLSSHLGYAITLPTEQQWEKAARGTNGRIFPWGDTYEIGYANIDETHKEQIVGNYYLGTTTAVGLYPQGKSPFQALDLSGNVWEWTLTEWENKKSNSLDNNNARVMRGSSWNYQVRVARAAYRLGFSPLTRLGILGFRLVCLSPF